MQGNAGWPRKPGKIGILRGAFKKFCNSTIKNMDMLQTILYFSI